MILETKNKKIKREIEICKMSNEPAYYGIAIKLSDPLWKEIKENKTFFLDKKECKVTQEIDIGENTWFIFEIL
ncbi:MAG: hypothetical protein QXG55_04840 [Thermoplasmata archaeon]